MAHSLGLSIMQHQPEGNDSVYNIVQGDISTLVALLTPGVDANGSLLGLN